MNQATGVKENGVREIKEAVWTVVLPTETSGVIPMLCSSASASLLFLSRSESSCSAVGSFSCSAYYMDTHIYISFFINYTHFIIHFFY